MSGIFCTTVHTIIVAIMMIVTRWLMPNCFGILRWQLHHSPNKQRLRDLGGWNLHWKVPSPATQITQGAMDRVAEMAGMAELF